MNLPCMRDIHGAAQICMNESAVGPVWALLSRACNIDTKSCKVFRMNLQDKHYIERHGLGVEEGWRNFSIVSSSSIRFRISERYFSSAFSRAICSIFKEYFKSDSENQQRASQVSGLYAYLEVIEEGEAESLPHHSHFLYSSHPFL
jgi:hypothetical protein